MRCEIINSLGNRCKKKATGRFRGKKTCRSCYEVLSKSSELRRKEILNRDKIKKRKSVVDEMCELQKKIK